jgi:hypothetical protein
MTLLEFKNSLNNPTPPHVPTLLKALWHDARGEWDNAHNLAQDEHSNDGSWIHAYLHRKQGDRSNAQYWYHHAKRKMPACSLEQEWSEIVSELLTSPHQ